MLFTTNIILIALICYVQSILSLPLNKRLAGEATYYKVGLGSCGNVHSDSDMVGALSSSQMQGGNFCGKTITVNGENGSIDIEIVDTCPGCAEGDVDMSEAAFAKLADLDKGRIPVSWSA